MSRQKLFYGLRVTLASMTALALLTTSQAYAQTETLLHAFGPSGDGANPSAALTMDSAGNLFGTTPYGGVNGSGSVYRLSPKAGGGYTYKIINSINPSGGYDLASGVIFDNAGNLFGALFSGSLLDGGSVFELVHQSNGAWSEKPLYAFNSFSSTAPWRPTSLIFDSAGNLYGCAWAGGVNGVGGVFQLVHNASGTWATKTLVSFDRATGYGCQSPMILDASGNLYGTLAYGGLGNGYGDVFEAVHNADGTWTEKTLYAFDSTHGASPYGGLVFDSVGNLYGTASLGGDFNAGIVFELSPQSDGTWTQTVLHSFANNTSDGGTPFCSLTFDAAGNLYGTTYYGGTFNAGTVWKLSPQTGGAWTETIVHNFVNGKRDGQNPYAGVTIDASGNLVGTTYVGGPYRNGVVFEIKP